MEAYNIELDYDIDTFLSRRPPTPTPQYLPETIVVSEPPSKKRRGRKNQPSAEPSAEPSAKPASVKPSAINLSSKHAGT
ncbi:unnamed protein product [Ceutorhynchus assimilis]|uniref:Uncharacterized protein n=1 Tax=Ceutorhynchus assimilis TaxID=467358 RepID=A0A9N9N1N6_9CUCU|nr:unnamed protein product [Ceutorhynchus assimilis]